MIFIGSETVGNTHYNYVFLIPFLEQQKILNSVEYYDFHERKWRNIAPMNVAKKYVGAAILDGQLYAVGGVNQEFSDLATVECYSPSSSQWQSIAPMEKCKGDEKVCCLSQFPYQANRVLCERCKLSIPLEPQIFFWALFVTA